MDYLDPMESSKELSNRGARGVTAVIGGVVLLVLKGVASAFGGVVGVVLGGASIALGASGLKGGTKADKAGGAIAVGAGALLALTGLAHWHIPIISGLASLSTGLVGLGAVGLLGYGAYNLFKFVKGLRNRA